MSWRRAVRRLFLTDDDFVEQFQHHFARYYRYVKILLNAAHKFVDIFPHVFCVSQFRFESGNFLPQILLFGKVAVDKFHTKFFGHLPKVYLRMPCSSDRPARRFSLSSSLLPLPFLYPTVRKHRVSPDKSFTNTLFVLGYDFRFRSYIVEYDFMNHVPVDNACISFSAPCSQSAFISNEMLLTPTA